MAFRSGDAEIFFRDSDRAKLEAADIEFACAVDYPETIDQFSGQARTGVVNGKPVMTYATAAPGRKLTNADYVVIDGVRWQIQAPRQVDDGLHSQADLKRA
jgi:hypothetical protein